MGSDIGRVSQRTCRGHVLAVVLAAILGACATEADSPACFTLEEVTRYGHANVETVGLDARGIEAGAGVLSNIRGVVVGPTGAVLVLDSSWQKIVVFAPGGSVERVILGGEGQGPGEFVLPIHVTGTEGGISVLDYDQLRISQFAWSGELRSIEPIDVARPFRHLRRGDTLWVTRSGGGGASTGPIVYTVVRPNATMIEGPPLDAVDQPFGLSVALAAGADGDILVTTARPGVWMSRTGSGTWERRGSPLFPEDPPPIEEQIQPRLTQITPSQYAASGIGKVGDSLVVQGWTAFARPFNWDDPPGADEIAHSLGVFSPEGRHLTTIRLEAGVSSTYLHVDPPSGRLFLHAMEPFPQVVEYRLAVCDA